MLSIRSAAAQLGISHTALRKRIGHGKVSWPPASMAALRAEWEVNKDVIQQQRGAGSTSIPQALRPVSAVPAAPGRAVRSPDTGGAPTLSVSQAREAALKVEERALKVARAKEKLVDANQVKIMVSGMIVAARNSLLIIPDELCEKLAPITDPIVIREMLYDRLCQSLEHLVEYRPSA